ncbi:MAG: hypothetical protein R2867_45835 [Caldilineaceae bacterium]
MGRHNIRRSTISLPRSSLPGDVTDTTGTYQPNPKFMWQIGGGDDINSAQHRTAETFPYHGQSAVLHPRTGVRAHGRGHGFLCFFDWATDLPQRIGLRQSGRNACRPESAISFISGVINNDNLLSYRKPA